MRKYAYRGQKKEYFHTSVKKLKKMIVKCHHFLLDENFGDRNINEINSKMDTSITGLLNDRIYDYELNDSDIVYLAFEPNKQQKGAMTNNILFEHEIHDPIILERYYQLKFYPYIDHSNAPKYKYKISDIKNILSECKQNINGLDEIINKLITEENIDPDDIVLLDIPNTVQKGGVNVPSDDFNKKIVVTEDNGMILPNDTIFYPNGQVVKKISKREHNNNIR